jgi:RNA polymerase sigma factor (sigma-70 family)
MDASASPSAEVSLTLRDDKRESPAWIEEAFSQTYRTHHRAVYRYILALSRSADEAEEVAAETFARALLAMRRDQSTDSIALPWLLLTARRITTDRWRRARNLARLVPLTRGLGGERVGDMETSEFWIWFNDLCRVLPRRQREVFILRYQRDLSDNDIGAIMRLSASGVRSLVARAVQTLREHEELLR